MGCQTVIFGDGAGTAVICGRGGRRCHRCSKSSAFQCDFPIGKYKSGKKKGTTRTCDKHLCFDHVRHGVTKGVDFCDQHYPIAKAAYERKQQEKKINGKTAIC